MTSPLKSSFFLSLGILLFSFVSFSMVSGKAPWIHERTDAMTPHLDREERSLASTTDGRQNDSVEAVPEAVPQLSAENISVENIRFAAAEDAVHTFFMKENKLMIECELRHKLPLLHSYTVVIKTDREEIFRKTVTPASKEQTLAFSASYAPRNSGTLPVACRADLENTVQESDERDNRMVKFLLVF